MNTKTCYERILGIVCSVFDAYSAVLILPDRDGRTHSVGASFSLGDRVNKKANVASGKGLVGWIINNQSPMLVNDFDTHKFHLGYYTNNEESQIKAFMGVPLRNEAGVLCLDSKRQYSFSNKDQKILQLFGELVYEVQSSSCMIEEQVNLSRFYNSLQLIYSLRKRHTNWNKFLAQFLGLMAETTSFEYCSFASRDELGQNYHIEDETTTLARNDSGIGIPYGSGVVGWVFKSGKPVFVGADSGNSQLSPLYGKNTNQPAFQSVISLPLTISKIPRGVLTFASETPRSIPDELKIFCHMASEHLALFLENLYLKVRLYEADQQISSLRRPEPAVTETEYTPQIEESE